MFQGTALQIVKAMQELAFVAQRYPFAQYVEWVAANARKFDLVDLAIKGQTDDELAASLVDEIVRTGLAARA